MRIRTFQDIKIGEKCKLIYCGFTINNHVSSLYGFYNKECEILDTEYDDVNEGKYLLLNLDDNYHTWWVPYFNVIFEDEIKPIDKSKLKNGLKLIIGKEYTTNYLADVWTNFNQIKFSKGTNIEVIDYVIKDNKHNEILVKCNVCDMNVNIYVPISVLYEKKPIYSPRILKID